RAAAAGWEITTLSPSSYASRREMRPAKTQATIPTSLPLASHSAKGKVLLRSSLFARASTRTPSAPISERKTTATIALFPVRRLEPDARHLVQLGSDLALPAVRAFVRHVRDSEFGPIQG